MKHNKLVALFLSLICFTPVHADEGMWLPMLLDKYNIKDMQQKGFMLTASDIYDVNKTSMKDAVVQFGGGCTGSVISNSGLLLTNHHCGNSQIQRHSSVKNDYLKNGFWAMNFSEELTNPGLTATFIIRMEDVTNQVLQNVLPGMSENQRDSVAKTAMSAITKTAKVDNHYDAFVRSFFFGNQYILFVTEVFKDVRLVGAPPTSIGKFGGVTDNWMWPRQTGDFALFRIYAGSDNKPAEYAAENKPFVPRYSFPISLKGVAEGDFTLVYGFPGRTNSYLPAVAVDQILNLSDPARVAMRAIRLDAMESAMRLSDEVRIQYAAKQATVSNAYKKWIGEMKGLNKSDAVNNKLEAEKAFQQWAAKPENSAKGYDKILDEYVKIYKELAQYQAANDHINEAAFGIELLEFAWAFRNLVESAEEQDVNQEELKKKADKLITGTDNFFKDYYQPIDEQVFPLLLKAYMEGVSKNFIPERTVQLVAKFGGDYQKVSDYVFKKSMFADHQKLTTFLSKYKSTSAGKIKKDPAYKLMTDLVNKYREDVSPMFRSYNNQLDSLGRIYVKAQMEMTPQKTFYPDANSTLRVAYGKVEGYFPYDGAQYIYYTTLEGIIEKGNYKMEDYQVPQKLKDLHAQKDYGQYGANGELRVCFLASNHTTGGNSGSPILNANGNLIGINFDRNWEGTMSDVNYDISQVRNISVDIRYILFVVDKFAGAGYLVDEMKIVK